MYNAYQEFLNLQRQLGYPQPQGTNGDSVLAGPAVYTAEQAGNSPPGTYGPFQPPSTTPPVTNNTSTGSIGAQAPSGFDALLRAAQGARENAMRQAQQNYDLGRNVYQQGMDTLGTRRKQFQEMFTNTEGDIAQGYEGNRGEMQASAAGEATRSANALRALGLGGSAVLNAQGRQTQQNMKALGNLQNSRMVSDRANSANLGEQTLWAGAQENSLNNYLKSLENQKQAIESGAGTDFQNILGQLGNNLASLQAAQQGVSSYVANPTDIADFLNTNTDVANGSSWGNTGTQTLTDNSQVNINQNDPNLWYKKLMGLTA